MVMYQEYAPEPKQPTREFQTALAAFHCGDANPMRQYLGLPLQVPCDDCDTDAPFIPHGKSLLCADCFVDRESFLSDLYSGHVNALSV